MASVSICNSNSVTVLLFHLSPSLFFGIFFFLQKIIGAAYYCYSTKTRQDYTDLMSTTLWKDLQSDLESQIRKTEVHQARALNGHI